LPPLQQDYSRCRVLCSGGPVWWEMGKI